MKSRIQWSAAALLLLSALPLHAQRTRAVRTPKTLVIATAEPAACALAPAVPEVCDEGGGSFTSLSSAEVDAIVRAAARALDVNTLTIAVADRVGRPLAVFRKTGATAANDDLALGVARTAAFFSHDMAPLSARTVRFISDVHFPPGISNTPSGALYGIGNTNRGCDFNVTFHAGKCIPRARRLGGTNCNSSDTSGCGPGIVTNANAGGVPLYRAGKLVGGIGVVGADGDAQRAEFAAASGAFGGGFAPVPVYPLPQPGNVFIDGIRLPFLGPDIRLTFSGNAPNGVALKGTTPGTDTGTYVLAPQNGGCAANEYLVGPLAGSKLTAVEVDAIVQRAVATAKRTRAAIRLPLNRYARMVISVADTDGSILALYRMPDATVFSVDVAVAKARNVVWFSTSNDLGVPANTAVTNRTIGFGGQPFFPPGIDSEVLDPRPGPWYASLFLSDLAKPCTQGTQPLNANQNGIVFFAGSSPLYRGGAIAGGLGVSGDGIEQDDYVTYFGAGEFLPPQNIWADQVTIDGARLPMFKFPRQPEGVTECGGDPCS